jgi:hypothetical protein
MSEKFKMPSVKVGDQVLWRPGLDPTLEPRIAFVTGVSEHSVELSVIEGGFHNFLTRSAVRHRDTPNLRVEEYEDVGLWEEGKHTKAVATLEAKVMQLAVTVEDLKRRLESKKV